MPRGKRSMKASKEVVTEVVTEMADDSHSNKENQGIVVHMQEEMQMDVDMDVEEPDAPAAPPIARASKFREATMNSTNSIRPPPDEQWAALGIDHLLEGYNKESKAPPSLSAPRKRVSRTPSASTVPTTSTPESAALTKTSSILTTNEGTFGRFSRAVASFFQSGTFSSLGKRKAGNETAEKDSNGATSAGVDRGDAKERAEAAYAEAMSRGLLPAPKVFIRPVSRARAQAVPPHSTPHNSSTLSLPRTPTLYHSPSKRDLQRQKKLTKRVSNLEHKLAEARKELALSLSEHVPPVPPVPSDMLSPPKTDPPAPAPMKLFWHDDHDLKTDESDHDRAITNPSPSSTTTSTPGKIVKKRKAKGASDDEYKPITTDSDFSHEDGGGGSERESKRPKATSSKLKRRQSTRSIKKNKDASVPSPIQQKEEKKKKEEDVVIVVPDARVGVPPIPAIPRDVGGRRVEPLRDAYGGLEHEMF